MCGKINSVRIQDLYSCENYKNGESLSPVLDNISLCVAEGTCFGISSKDGYETRLLCEIIANIKPYFSGKCVLNETGMFKQKGKILSHIYYIDNQNTLYENMNVLEYLMFATAPDKSENNIVVKQKNIFEMLLKAGLGYISLSNISVLTTEEKLLVGIFAALFAKSNIYIFDLTYYDLSDNDISILKNIINLYSQRNKTVIIGSLQAKLIGICCDSLTFIVNSKQRFTGTTQQLTMQADRVLYIIRHNDIEQMQESLKTAFPDYEIQRNGSILLVMRTGTNPRDDKHFYTILANNGITPDSIKTNRGRIQNSFEEILQYDL